jgi:hypothetical protein
VGGGGEGLLFYLAHIKSTSKMAFLLKTSEIKRIVRFFVFFTNISPAVRIP